MIPNKITFSDGFGGNKIRIDGVKRWKRHTKKTVGGEFVLPQAGVTIPMKNNRMILFPSYYTHAVNPVKFDGEKNQGLGRHTITHFYNWEGGN